MKILFRAIFQNALTTAAWVPLLVVCSLITGCQTAAPARLPERPTALVSAVALDKAVDHAVNDLLIQAQRLPELRAPPPASGLDAVLRKEQPPPPMIRIVVDSALDGVSGQQTVATRSVDKRLLSGIKARFPGFLVAPMSSGDLATARFILTATLTVSERRENTLSSYRINLSLTDGGSGFVVAQAASQATGETVDATPTVFYRDSPSLTKDRTIEGHIQTAQTPAGKPADGVYLSNLSVASLIAEGSRLYEAEKYLEALAVYEIAVARPDGKHLRVYNGLYLSNMQLGRVDAAEQVFSRLVSLGLATNSLSVKFLFKPGSTDFWPDPKINAIYPMWIRVLAREIVAAKTCVTIAGHTSRSGAEALNDRLSLLRAGAIQKRLETATPDITGRLTSAGLGFRENLIGTGADDASDALDRRVEFRVRGC